MVKKDEKQEFFNWLIRNILCMYEKIKFFIIVSSTNMKQIRKRRLG